MRDICCLARVCQCVGPDISIKISRIISYMSIGYAELMRERHVESSSLNYVD